MIVADMRAIGLKPVGIAIGLFRSMAIALIYGIIIRLYERTIYG